MMATRRGDRLSILPRKYCSTPLCYYVRNQRSNLMVWLLLGMNGSMWVVVFVVWILNSAGMPKFWLILACGWTLFPLLNCCRRVIWPNLRSFCPALTHRGGHSGVCNMGTCDSSFFRFLGSFIVFQAVETWICFIRHHIVTAIMYEGNRAYKTGPEKETKDASSLSM